MGKKGEKQKKTMSGCNELMTIFKRMRDRVNGGSENFLVLSRIIQKRADIEDKIAEMLKGSVPADYDKDDPLLVNTIDEITREIELHQKLSQELRAKVIQPTLQFQTTLTTNQKKLDKSISQHIKTLDKAMGDVDKCKRNCEDANVKLSQLEGSKRDSQQKKVQKCVVELQRAQAKAEQTSVNLQGNVIPTIHTEFSHFDESRLCTMQSTICHHADAKISFFDETKVFTQQLIVKTHTYDGKDRSERFIAKVFDTQQQTVTEEDDALAIAISDFRSEEPSDLTFERGDRIKILLQHSSGWWEGEFNGKKGHFPKTFIEMPGARQDKIGKNTTIGAVFLVTKDFKSTRISDIDLLVGDLVYVEYLCKNKCSGRNLRTGKKGNFPLGCLEQRL